MNENFPLRPESQCSFRNLLHFYIPRVKGLNCDHESIRDLGPKILEAIPFHVKDSNSLDLCKSKIKQWKPESFMCRLYKVCIQHEGYI